MLANTKPPQIILHHALTLDDLTRTAHAAGFEMLGSPFVGTFTLGGVERELWAVVVQVADNKLTRHHTPPVRAEHNYGFIAGDTLVASFWYPRHDQVKKLSVCLMDVRAADRMSVEYDFERDGWVVKQPATSADGDREEMQEVFFAQAWALEGKLPDAPTV